jgi:predicted amidohydrolase YtcJ
MGTDFPVEGVDPLVSFWAGTTRRSLESREGEGDGGWFPNQRLTRTQALRALTIDAAYASFNERFLGSLESGKKADFVVLGLDVMKVEDEKLREAVLRGTSGEGEGIVKATVLDGVLVFGDLDDC